MEAIFFYLFSGLTLVCALLVVANPFSRNPVTSAMFLVLAIASMAGLFVMLHAFFLAAVQILVYAGAVMVLFLFVIMMLNVREEERQRFRLLNLAAGVGTVGVATALILRLVFREAPAASGELRLEGGAVELGRLLFTQYLLPFEMVSVLLLAAMVGVIVLSKKNLK